MIKMAGDEGIEPTPDAPKASALPLCKSPVKLERVAGIEPAHRLWKSLRLPLHHTRKNGGWRKIRTFGGFHLGALAKLCIRPLCHPTIYCLHLKIYQHN